MDLQISCSLRAAVTLRTWYTARSRNSSSPPCIKRGSDEKKGGRVRRSSRPALSDLQGEVEWRWRLCDSDPESGETACHAICPATRRKDRAGLEPGQRQVRISPDLEIKCGNLSHGAAGKRVSPSAKMTGLLSNEADVHLPSRSPANVYQ